MEFSGCFVEDGGVLVPGTLRVSENEVAFKGGKTVKIPSADISNILWQKLGNKPGLRFALKDGVANRFGGLEDTDYEKIKDFASSKWSKNVEKSDLVIKGWNYGQADVHGKNIEFTWEDKPIFEIPCTAVAECTAAKNEAYLSFHQRDEAPISLFEMRIHMPVDEDGGADQAEEFKKAVLAFAGVETETEQPIVLLNEILCMAPRGRYDIKVFPTSIGMHGKTHDYKFPIKNITRLFMVPHKDGRHVYFVLSLNPPIRQGQTRYSYLVFEFVKDEEQDFDLGLTDDQLAEYGGQLKREMSGPIYESVSLIFKIVCNLRITVPGKFIGNSGTPAIQCAHKQNPGLLYPLEKGFLFIHKPAMYVRFDEIASCHFARSDAGVTRTIDFELDLKTGTSLMFNSIDKDENNKLYDYLNKKGLKIRNAQKIDAAKDLDSSDDEIDPYRAAVKAEGRQRDDSDSDSTDEDYDLDKDLKKKQKEKDSSEGSGSEPDDEYDSGSEQDSSGTAESEPEDEETSGKKKREPKEKKAKKEKPEKGEKKEKKGKKVKDPNEPKRATTAYFIWFTANRLKLKKDGDTVAEVAKKGGEAWKKMSAEDKKEWEEKAAEDKIRYENEMKEYRKNGGGAGASSSSAKPSKKSTGSTPSKAAKSKEYISSDESDDEEEEPKKKKKAPAPKEDSEEEEEEESDGSEDSD